MIRCIEFNLDEVVIDPAGYSETLNKACVRYNAAVTGVCSNEHTLIIVVDTDIVLTGKYRLAQFPGFSKDEIIGEINSRWTAGFSTVGSFYAGKFVWGIFMTTAESR
jgi:hypothetical protein